MFSLSLIALGCSETESPDAADMATDEALEDQATPEPDEGAMCVPERLDCSRVTSSLTFDASTRSVRVLEEFEGTAIGSATLSGNYFAAVGGGLGGMLGRNFELEGVPQDGSFLFDLSELEDASQAQLRRLVYGGVCASSSRELELLIVWNFDTDEPDTMCSDPGT